MELSQDSAGAGKGQINGGSMQVDCIVGYFVGRILQLFLPTFRETGRIVFLRHFVSQLIVTSDLFARLAKSN